MSFTSNSLKEIRAGLVTVMKLIKTANGYLSNFEDSNIHRGWAQHIFADTNTSLFPRMFLVLDDGTFESELGGVLSDDLRFLVFAQFQRTTRADVEPYELEDAKDNFIQDFRTAINRNSTLGGLVQDVQLPQFASDSGTMDPLGLVVFEVVVQELGE